VRRFGACAGLAAPRRGGVGGSCSVHKGGDVYARVATFESDAANLDDAISMVRAEVESGETPEDLEGAKMLILLRGARADSRSLGR
jgi:hypothetical protein